MKKEEKVKLLAEILDIDNETISGDMNLNDVEEWDSLAKISYISMVEDNFEKIVGQEEIKRCLTINDLIDMME